MIEKEDYRIYMISFQNVQHKDGYNCIHKDQPPEPWQWQLVKDWLDQHATGPVKEGVSASDFI